MSINTMTSNAVAARAQDSRSNLTLTNGAANATGPLGSIANYIPTEVLSVYIAALSLIAQAEPSSGPPSVAGLGHDPLESIKLITFWLGVCLTPAVVWCSFAVKLKARGGVLPLNPLEWPWWSLFAATLSFAIWAMALPSSGVAVFAGVYGNLVAGILVLAVGSTLALFAPLFSPGGEPVRPLANTADGLRA